VGSEQPAEAGRRPHVRLLAARLYVRLYVRLWARLRGQARLWLSVFGVSLALFAVRLLVPVPVGEADGKDGPRLMCGLGVTKVTGGHPAFFRYAYFEYISAPACAGRAPYPTSEIVPVELARALTPVLGLSGTINLIALGLLMCATAAAGIATLVTGLRIGLCARLLIAAAVLLVVADAAFFDVFATPFEEPAALTGLLLVAAGVTYLGRGWRSTRLGLVVAGLGGFLAILSKEQYLILAAPVCLTLVLASGARGRSPGRGLRRYRTRQTGAGFLVAAALALMTGAYMVWDYTSHYGRRLHMIQAVDLIFNRIATTRANAPAALRALGLPLAWTRYAGTYYWAPRSVRKSPLFQRYAGQFNDVSLARYLLTHPGRALSIGQLAATQAQQFRITTLGDYPVYAGHPKGAVESRVAVLSWLVHQLPAHLGLWLYLPLWVVLAVLAIGALRRPGKPWHRDGAVLMLCMTGCAFMAFIPPAYFAGISTTRHMVGTNLATALALIIGVALTVSMVQQALAGGRRKLPEPGPAPPTPEVLKPASQGGPHRR
jgi:hypothetical protein